MFDSSGQEARRREIRRRMMRASGRRHTLKKRVLERDTNVRRWTLRALAYLVIPLCGPSVLADELADLAEELLGSVDEDQDESTDDEPVFDEAEFTDMLDNDTPLRCSAGGRLLFVEREAQNTRHIQRLQALLQTELERSERTLSAPHPVLEKNIAALGDAMQLSIEERCVLTFVIAVQLDPTLHKVIEAIEGFWGASLSTNLAEILGIDEGAVRRAVQPAGVLRRARLLEPSDLHGLHDASPEQLASWIAESVTVVHANDDALLARLMTRAPAPARTVADFEYTRDLAPTLVSLVRNALAENGRGVNVLIHGLPGVGKTELVRVIAAAAGSLLYEVPSADEHNEPLPGEQRAGRLVFLQQLLARRRDAVVLFDEAEDMFPRRLAFFGVERRQGGAKAWMHSVLEEAPAVTFWLCNSVDQLDPALVRRFTLVVELGTPPTRVRQRMLTEALQDHIVDAAWITRVAKDARVTPAHVQSCARVLSLVRPAVGAATERLLDRALDGQFSATGQRAIGLARTRHAQPLQYSMDLLNVDVDLAKVLDGLEKRGRGTVLLEGPPGVGKTALVAEVARRLDRPLRAVRASDLLGPFVGMTENAINAAFRAASDEGAVLFFDEADSFLRDRTNATQSWQVTQVNELLEQMESFDGLFFCATNLLSELDAASLRRFDVKVRMRPMTPEQRERAFARVLRLDAARSITPEARRSLGALDGLTLGDFAAALRALTLAGVEEPDEPALLAQLRSEFAYRKSGSSKTRAGFGL